MNAKHLFLTVMLLFASMSMMWGSTKTDVISISAITGEYGSGRGLKTLNSSLVLSSDARYAGQVYYNPSPSYLLFNSTRKSRIMSTTSGGLVSSVTVNWTGTNTSGTSEVLIIVRDVAFTGSESLSDLAGYIAAGTATAIESIVYDGSSSQTRAIAGSYHYVAVYSNSSTAQISSVDIEWTIEDKYSITMDSGYDDWEGEVSINDVVAEADKEVVKAKAGDDVKITVTPNPEDFYYIESITFGDMVFDMSCMTPVESGDDPYVMHVIMPNGPVEVSVVFAEMEFKDDQDITFKHEGDVVTSSEVESGLSKTFTFNLSRYAGTSPEYTGRVTYSVDDEDALSVESFSYNNETGEGTFTVIGFIGSTNVRITTAKTVWVNEWEEILPLTVNPREVALIAEHDGSYYAALNSIDGAGKAGAQEVFRSGDNFYYDLSGADVDDMTWYVSTLTEAQTTFAIQNDAEKFLAISGKNLQFNNSKYTWYKDEGRFLDINDMGIIYQESSSKFFTSTTLTTAVKEYVIATNFLPLNYSTTSSSAGVYDTRTLGEGDWGTICVPFDVTDVSESGADFFTLTGKHVEAEELVGFYLSNSPVSSLTAGRSYIYHVQAGKSAINLNGASAILTEADNSVLTDGFVGILPGDCDGTGKVRVENESKDKVNGNFVMSGGKFRYISAGGASNVKAYRAYIDAGELDASSGTPAPGRRILYIKDMQDVATDIEDLTVGQLIDWSKPVYNIMGMQVGKGATGVLIQDGQKFIVQ